MVTQAVVVDPLIERLREAVKLREVAAIAGRIKHELETFIPEEGLRLPERFRRPQPGSYARRLLYRDPELDFTAVIMTWGPGQRTALHDHAGIWCVEGVVEGEMEVLRYELLGEEGEGLYRFVERDAAHARAGSAGALIPPYEHHVLANNRPDATSLTLHVYGGEMDHCSVFEKVEPAASAATEAPAGWTEGALYRRTEKRLEYTA